MYIMKRILPALIFAVTFCQLLNSQNLVSQGKPIAEIFTDFHYNLDDSSKTTGFGLERAYLGYNFLPAGYFSGSVIVNIGNPDDISPESVRRRYAFFREASIRYTKGDLRISFGITDTHMFDFQQKFWGKRFIAKSFQSINGYGNVADLGFVAEYKFNDVWKGDIELMNGEGYSDIQLDNGVKTSAGITFTPAKQIAVRIYGDIENPHYRWRYTLIGFLGFRNDLIRIGAEASYKSNLDMIGGHNAWGLTGTGCISILKKTELFARYDYATSVTVPGENVQWNSMNDGRFAIIGLEYTFNENAKMALNYQGTFPYSSDKHISSAIYVNAMFRF
jgi:hypothetical protein